MLLDERSAVAVELLNLTFHDIATFDDEAVGGEGVAYYEQSQIIDAVVYRNKLFARVGNYFESHRVRLAFHDKELTSRCTCDGENQICVHAVALLYAWINDAPEFMNLTEVLAEIRNLEPERLIQVVANILQQQPHLAVDFLKTNKPDWDEITLDPAL